MHIRAHGSLFDDGCLYRLAERGGERGGILIVHLVVYYLGRYLPEVCCRVLIVLCARERERDGCRWGNDGKQYFFPVGGRAASWNGVYTTYLEGGRRHDLYVQR